MMFEVATFAQPQGYIPIYVFPFIQVWNLLILSVLKLSPVNTWDFLSDFLSERKLGRFFYLQKTHSHGPAVGETELIALVVAGPQPCEKETDRSARVQFIFPQNRVSLMSYSAIPSILWSFLEVMIKPFILDDHRTIPACGGCSHPPVGAALVVINS
jgi:hypothetical protein